MIPDRLLAVMGVVALSLAGAGALRAQGLPPSQAAAALARLAAESSAPPPPPPQAGPVARSFVLRRVLFSAPSGYFDSETLERAVAPLIGTRMAPAGAARVAEAINALYQQAGIELALARVVGVDPGAGSVTIDLFEARLGEIRASAARIRSEYLLMRLAVKSGALADTRRIARHVERLWLTDGLAAEVAFSPGAAPGLTDLTARFAAPPPVQATLRLDNHASASTGPARLTFSGRINSLTGWNDPLSLDATLSQGAQSATLSYARVLTPQGGRFTASLSHQSSNSVGPPAVTSRTDSAEIGYSLPVLLETGRSLTPSLSFERFHTRTTTAGVTTASQTGWTLNLALSGALGGERYQLSGALGLLGGRYDDAVAGTTGTAYAAINASGQGKWALGERAILSLSGGAQYALSRTLPGPVGFSVTSPDTVPGYDPGLSQGDGGYWLRAELAAARPLSVAGVDLYPYALAAFGQAYDRSIGGGWSGQGLASAIGGGITGQIGGNASLDFQIARSLTSVLGQGGDGSITLRGAISWTF